MLCTPLLVTKPPWLDVVYRQHKLAYKLTWNPNNLHFQPSSLGTLITLGRATFSCTLFGWFPSVNLQTWQLLGQGDTPPCRVIAVNWGPWGIDLSSGV